MRLIPALACVAVLASCAAPAPLPAPDNATAPNFAPPSKGSLIVLVPPPQSKGTEVGENMMGTQLDSQLKAAGYRVATLQRDNYEQLWSQEAAAVGGVFDGASGAVRPQALATALASLARRVCEEAKCALLIRQRLVSRQAKLEGSQAEWDGTRQQIRLSNTHSRDYRFSGTTSALSVELIAVTDRGAFAFRRFGGATLPFETNIRETKNELRKNLFGTDTEITEGVRVALEPLTKQ